MKKGFTLVELLAVIVILGVLALITVPIVTNIINKAEEDSDTRSAELYIDAVDTAMMSAGTLDLKNTTCTVQNDGNLNCDGTIIFVEAKHTRPTSGTLTIVNRRVTKVEDLAIGDGVYKTNNSGEIVTNDTYVQVFKPQYYSWDLSGSLTNPNYPLNVPNSLSSHPPIDKDFYLGYDISNNKVSAVYVCFKNNQEEICLRGGRDMDVYTENATILRNKFSTIPAAQCDYSASHCSFEVDGLEFFINSSGYARISGDGYVCFACVDAPCSCGCGVDTHN